ncbi:MAG: transmembrane anchor protein [Acidobacteria bacterium]|nr:transmembrane anchor protein [Acidobacteriota bacterium]
MFQAPAPPPDALPAPRALRRSTIIALCTATALLITVVLPAEYGVDPTGVGQLLGLKRMGEIKVALALEAEADAAADAAALAAEEVAAATFAASSESAPTEAASDEGGGTLEMAEIVLQPDEGKEIKLVMREGASIRYEWWTIGGVVNFETHADPPVAQAGSYHSYSKGQDQTSDEGVLTAAFDGLHGWSWRNRTKEVVTVTLRVEGDFQELREIR